VNHSSYGRTLDVDLPRGKKTTLNAQRTNRLVSSQQLNVGRGALSVAR